ncbi:hypothetical protein, partial [Shinella sumterensis]|uniref:hypothetical protein n=1 Tax=Shinella sumterensis TaxID=1967501 RepID=UPI001ADB54C7
MRETLAVRLIAVSGKVLALLNRALHKTPVFRGFPAHAAMIPRADAAGMISIRQSGEPRESVASGKGVWWLRFRAAQAFFGGGLVLLQAWQGFAAHSGWPMRLVR